VDASLKKLRTSYIDILYLHWWDYGTSVEEVVDSLHTLVLQGKVLYLVRIHRSTIHLPRNFYDLVSLGNFR
jgi:aryl-alcohol dehydrogenase-like predicted oxidoreductase